MTALSMYKSISKNIFKNSVYVLIVTTAFTAINLFFSTILTSSKLQNHCEYLKAENIIDDQMLLVIISPIQISMASTITTIVMIVVLCVLTFPIITYIFSASRGYEIGVLRALGMSKRNSFKRLVCENVVLMCLSLFLSQSITMLTYKIFIYKLLPLTRMEELLSNFISNMNGFQKCLSVDFKVFLLVALIALIVTSISSVLNLLVLSRSNPIKLIANYK